LKTFLKEKDIMIKTKFDLDKAKKEFEKLDAETQADISELRNCLDAETGKGVSRKTKDKMAKLDAKVALMKTIKQRIDSETPPADSRETRKKTFPSIQFRDELKRKIDVLDLCVEGASNFMNESSNTGFGNGLATSFLSLRDFLEPILNGEAA
jgi:hypothetical protein